MIKYRYLWDRPGIALSVVCLVHCLLLPVAITMAPFMAARWLEAEEFHVAAALALVPVALLAMVPGLRRHGRRIAAAAMGAGLTLISTTAFAGKHLLSQVSATGVTVAGGLILIIARTVNLVLRRVCPGCATGGHDAPHP